MNLLSKIPLLRGLSSGISYCHLHEDNAPKIGQPIFVFVHGTWAVDAAWTLPSGRLVKTILTKWPTAGAYRFQWSGVNGLRHRLGAADRLAEELSTLQTRFPESPLVAIGHSHGGNVMSAASSTLSQPIYAAVYLNTPFIQVLKTKKLRVRLGSGLIFFLGPAWSIFAPQLLLAVLSYDHPHSWIASRWTSAAATIICFVSAGIIMNRLLKYIRNIRHCMANRYNAERRINRELVISVVGDEPAVALGSVYFAQWLSRKILLCSLPIVAFLIPLALFFASHHPSDVIFTENLLTYLCLLALLVLVLPFIASILGYGFIHSIVSLDATISVTSTPVGNVDCALIEWEEGQSMRHSIAYDSSVGIERLICWLQKHSSPEANPLTSLIA